MKHLITFLTFFSLLSIAYGEISFELKLNSGTTNNLSTVSGYTKGVEVESKGYFDFMSSVKNFDEDASFFKLSVDNLKSEDELKYNFEFELYESLDSYLNNKTSFYPIYSFKNLDKNFPYKGYLEYKGIKFGRDKINWGPGRFGNLMISDFSKYFDFLGFDKNLGKFTFKYVLVSIHPYETEKEKTVQALHGYIEPFKMFVAHRLEYKPIEELTLAITESEIMGGKIPELYLVNPLFIYHSSYTKNYANVMAGFDFEYKNSCFAAYGSFALDDWQVDNKFDNGTPNALAYLGGIEGYFNDVKATFEYGRTSSFIYNRWENYTKFTNRRVSSLTYTVGNEGDYIIDYPIGYFTGPDAETITFKISNPCLSFMWQRIFKGAYNIQSDYTELIKDPDDWFTLKGTVEKRDTFTLKYDDGFLFSKLKLEYISNFANEDQFVRNLQLYGGVRFKF